MDREARLAPWRVPGEPRARGDGPRRSRPEERNMRRAPRTRGWTACRLRAQNYTYESPAHAGMDRRVAHQDPRTDREPRARGDGPDYVDEDGYRLGRAPRTPGWIERATHVGSTGGESPAHAGTDRRGARLPLTRAPRAEHPLPHFQRRASSAPNPGRSILALCRRSTGRRRTSTNSVIPRVVG